jgi:hypothetical protein
MLQGGTLLHRSSSEATYTCGGAAWWSSSSSIWIRGRLHHQVLILDGAIHQMHLQETSRLGMGKAQVAANLVQAKPGTGGPKSWPMATSYRRVRQSICPGAVAARRIVATSEEGGHRFAYFVTCRNSKRHKFSLVSWQATAATPATAADSCDGAVVLFLSWGPPSGRLPSRWSLYGAGF